MVKAHEMNIQEQDIIVDVLNTIVEIAKKNGIALDATIVAESDNLIRGKWWGDRPYISKETGGGKSLRNESIWQDYRRGERVCFLAHKYTLTEKQIQRILASFKKQNENKPK